MKTVPRVENRAAARIGVEIALLKMMKYKTFIIIVTLENSKNPLLNWASTLVPK
jgi:hypothetical protein